LPPTETPFTLLAKLVQDTPVTICPSAAALPAKFKLVAPVFQIASAVGPVIVGGGGLAGHAAPLRVSPPSDPAHGSRCRMTPAGSVFGVDRVAPARRIGNHQPRFETLTTLSFAAWKFQIAICDIGRRGRSSQPDTFPPRGCRLLSDVIPRASAAP
jgi:hypothetical protein